MAIQNINLGTAPKGEGGDTLRSTAVKINENFSNATHAASRLLGTGAEQIPLGKDIFKASESLAPNIYEAGAVVDIDNLLVGTKHLLRDVLLPTRLKLLLSSEPYALIKTYRVYSDNNSYQTATGWLTGVTATRTKNGTWGEWGLVSTSKATYQQTTLEAPNVVVSPNGELKRSTATYQSLGLGTTEPMTGRVLAETVDTAPTQLGSWYGTWNIVHFKNYSQNSPNLPNWSQIMVNRNGAVNAVKIRTSYHGTVIEYDLYGTHNTTKDANGFIKAASPIVEVYADKVVLNGDAERQNVTYKKNGIGDYTITTESGLSTDGWYIELPKDMNGNPKVAVTLSEVEGVITLKSYKRIFSMETFTFEPDLNTPLDIPTDRWIDIRLNEIPVEQPEMPLEPTEGTNTPVAEAKAPSEPVEPYSEV